MKGLGRRVSTLAILAVMATATLGAVYTLWFENLTLKTAVATGTLNAAVTCGTGVADNDGIDINNDEIGDLAIADILGYPNPIPLKDVGMAAGETNPNLDPHSYVITVTNAYPGYAVDCELELRNIGTVPWHIETVSLKVYKNGDLLPGNLVCTGTPIIVGNCTWGTISPTQTGPDHSEMYFALTEDPRGCQIHNPLAWATSLIIGTNQEAEEGVTYTFVLEFQVNQWNESDWISCHVDNPAFPGPVLPTP